MSAPIFYGTLEDYEYKLGSHIFNREIIISAQIVP